MATPTLQNAHLSEVNPEFAPLIPSINEAFETIWTYNDMKEFRGNWTKRPANYPAYVPDQGFKTTFQQVPMSDGTEVEVRILKPEIAVGVSLPLLFVLHGGGWVVGTHDSENGLSRSVCVKNHAMVLSVDYRRAPEHRFPCALNDAYDVFQWVVQRAGSLGFSKDKIVLCGTSSGANLIAALALRLRDDGSLVKLAGQILNIPAVCHPSLFPQAKYELRSYEQNRDSPTINATNMRWFWEQYLPDVTPDPLASPLLAQTHAQLPPTLVQVAGLDPLRDEGIAYAKALQAAGVSTSLEVYPGLPHGFMLAYTMGFTTRYYQTMVEWLERLLG